MGTEQKKLIVLTIGFPFSGLVEVIGGPTIHNFDHGNDAAEFMEIHRREGRFRVIFRHSPALSGGVVDEFNGPIDLLRAEATRVREVAENEQVEVEGYGLVFNPYFDFLPVLIAAVGSGVQMVATTDWIRVLALTSGRGVAQHTSRYVCIPDRFGSGRVASWSLDAGIEGFKIVNVKDAAITGGAYASLLFEEPTGNILPDPLKTIIRDVGQLNLLLEQIRNRPDTLVIRHLEVLATNFKTGEPMKLLKKTLAEYGAVAGYAMLGAV